MWVWSLWLVSVGMGVQASVCGFGHHGWCLSVSMGVQASVCGFGHHGWCLLAWVSKLLYVWVWSSWLVSVSMGVQASVCGFGHHGWCLLAWVSKLLYVWVWSSWLVSQSVGMGVQAPVCVGVVIMVGVSVCWHGCPISCMCGCGHHGWYLSLLAWVSKLLYVWVWSSWLVSQSVGMGVQSPVCVGVVIMVGISVCWHGCPISCMCGCGHHGWFLCWHGCLNSCVDGFGHHGWCLLAWVSNLLYVWVWSSWLVTVGMGVQSPVCVGVVIMVGVSVGMGVQSLVCVGVVIMVGDC